MNYNEIEEEFKETSDLFDETSQFDKVIKYIIFNKLSETERRIILLYAEIGNQRGCGKALGVSAATVNLEIKKIRQHIYEELEKIKNGNIS